MKIFKTVLLFSLFFLLGCSNSTPPINKSTTLDVTVKSDSNCAFKNEILKIRLYSYNPMLADVSATLVEEITKTLNTPSQPFLYQTKIGTKTYRDPKLKYYLTVLVVDQNNKRTYYGYKNGKKGLAKVLEGGSSREILMILKPI